MIQQRLDMDDEGTRQDTREQNNATRLPHIASATQLLFLRFG
jgi:hypothetical protein